MATNTTQVAIVPAKSPHLVLAARLHPSIPPTSCQTEENISTPSLLITSVYDDVGYQDQAYYVPPAFVRAKHTH